MDKAKKEYIEKTAEEWSFAYKEGDRWQHAIDNLKDRINEYELEFQKYQRREYEANKALTETIDELDGEELQEAKDIIQPFLSDIAMVSAGLGDEFVDNPRR